MINPFSAIKAFFTVKSTFETLKQEAAMITTKPWYLRTEFWAHAVSQVGIVWSAIGGFIPPQYAAVIVSVSSAIYLIARTSYHAYVDVKSVVSPTVVSDAQTVVLNK